MRRRDPVLGRDRELEQLRRAVISTEVGTGGLVLVGGEAGVGKTSVVDEALASSDVLVLRSIASERGSIPYAPIAAALRLYLRDGPHGLTTSKEALGELEALLLELGTSAESDDPETLFDRIRTALVMIAATRPTVVFLDDLQWADAATLELLPSLAAAAEDCSLLVVVAYRSDEIPRGHGLRRLRADLRRARRLSEIVLEPLDEPATFALATRSLGGEPGPTLRAALYDRTQGVPFFVEELCAALLSGTALVTGGRGLEVAAGSTVPLPETIRDVVRLRAESLSGDAHRALEAASIAGTRFQLDLLSAIREDAGLGEILECGLLQELEAGVAAFRHDLVREAVYADTPWPRRRALHRLVAAELESRGEEPRHVADHWLAAHEDARALPFLLMTARKFCAVHAYRDAALAGRKALELWPEGENEPGRIELLRQLGRCAQLCGDLTEAARAWEEVAAALPPNEPEIAHVKRGLGIVYELQGRPERAVAARTAAAEAFAAAGEHDEAAADYLAFTEVALGDGERYLSVARAALAAARRAGRADLEARALAKEGWGLFRLNLPREGNEAARTALAIALAGKHVDAAIMAYWVLGAIASHRAEFDSAEAAFSAAIEFCEANDRSDEAGTCLSCLALVLYNRGEWKRAEEIARLVLEASASGPIAQGHAFWVLGFISAMRGATRRARAQLERAASARRSYGVTDNVEAAVGLAFVNEIENRPGEHWHDLAQRRPEASPLFFVQGLRWGSTFAALHGDVALVQACADALSTYSSRFGTVDAQAALAHALGEYALVEGDAFRACEQFTHALELLRDVDVPFDRAHVQLRTGVALAAAGEREAGIRRLVDAHRAFRTLGARPWALFAVRELEALGEPLERRLGRRAAGDVERGGLTRRELEILRLVAVGRTNREIGRDLFLSPRTVEMHVRHLLAKLDCRSRTEATGKAHALGLIEPAETL